MYLWEVCNYCVLRKVNGWAKERLCPHVMIVINHSLVYRGYIGIDSETNESTT